MDACKNLQELYLDIVKENLKEFIDYSKGLNNIKNIYLNLGKFKGLGDNDAQKLAYAIMHI